MKYLKQCLIILCLAFVGEVLHALIPLPVPASIYGILLLFCLLERKLLQVNDIKETAVFFIQIMPLLFVPAGVGLLKSWSVLKPDLLPYAVITIVSTIIVMAVTGRVTQFVIMKTQKKHHHTGGAA